MEFVEVTKEEFDKFMETEKTRNFWQTSYMGNFQEAEGKRVKYVGVKESGCLVAATLLVFTGMKFGYYRVDATRGFCLDYSNTELLRYFVNKVKEFAKKEKGMELVISPYFALRERDIDGNLVEDGFNHTSIVDELISLGFNHKGYSVGYTDEIEPRWIYCLDLKDKDLDTIFKETTRKNVRTDINSIEKRGLHVREMEEKDIATFYHMMEQTGERQEFAFREEAFYKAFHKEMSPILKSCIVEMRVNEYYDHTKERYDDLMKEKEVVQQRIDNAPENTRHQKRMRVVEEEIAIEEKNLNTIQELREEHGEVIPLSAGYFMTYGYEYMYLFGASYDHFLKYGGTTTMQWHMIQEAMNQDCTRYNFYGISGKFNKGDEGYGVYYFKRGFGGYVEELPGEFHMVLTPMYSLYNMLKKISGIFKR